MAQNPSLRPDEAYQAIESLVADGATPTHQAVRERVGGRGSPPVISRYINEWYAENGPAFAAKLVATRRDKPATTLAEQMMETAGRAAKLVSDAERERQEALDQRAAHLHEAEQALAGRELALLQQQEKLADRELEQAHLIAELRNDKSTMAAGLTQAREDRLQAEAELAKAAALLATLNAQLSQALKDSAGAEERERSSARALDDSRRRLSETAQLVDAFQASHVEAMAEVHRLQQSEREHRRVLLDQVDQAEKRLEQLQARLDLRASELQEAAARESLLQDRLAESSAALGAALRDSHALANSMAQHLRMVDQLREERDHAIGHATSIAESLSVIAAKIAPPRDSEAQG